MYIVRNNNTFSFTSSPADDPVAHLLPPLIVEGGTEKEPDDSFGYTDSVQDLGGGLFAVRRKVFNRGTQRRTIQLITRVDTCFRPDHYVMPCVNYNGNQWGGRNSPKGLTKDGQPWVFAYDRLGVPSCTLTENGQIGFALFASAENRDSLRSSCSLLDLGTHYQHRIHYPVIESPVSYTGNNKMTGKYEEFLTLAPGAQFTVTFYLFACVPEWKDYAFARLMDRLQDVFPYHLEPVFTPERVWDLGIAYLSFLIHNYHGRTLIIAGYDTVVSRIQAGHMGARMSREEMIELMKDPKNNTYGFNREIYEIGWAGQGALSTRLLLIDALRRGNREKVSLLIGSLENWVEVQNENGMFLPHFERYAAYQEALREGIEQKQEDVCQGWLPDVCNLGWAATEMSKIYSLLKTNGLDHPEFLQFAVRIANFFVKAFNPETGFGKLYTLEGKPMDGSGTVGGFMISALIDVYRVTGNEQYLTCARMASDFYYLRDLDHFVCTAGAIDCQSVDKETAYPFVVSSLDLYEITKDPLYLERARKAACYFFSWAFHYDPIYPDTADFSRFGYHAAGGTAISAEHHAIDPWGSLLCAEFVRLARYTGDSRWITRAKMMWNNSLYGITANEGDVVHGLARPLGSQNEGFFQARWTKYRLDPEERGHFNDWLVAWVSCWRLTALDRLTSVAGEKNWDLFR